MKKRISYQELSNLIQDEMISVWTAICDRLEIEESLDELEFCKLGATGAEDNFTNAVYELLKANDYTDRPTFKPKAIYTGGGIWICGMWLNDHEYVVGSNEYELELSYFDYDEDVKEGYTIAEHGEFPCIGLIRSTSVENMTENELLTIWKPIAEELHRNAY